MFRMEDSHFAFKLIRPQLNDNEKRNPALASQKKMMTSERLSSLPDFFCSISESQKAHNPQISLLIN